MAHLADIPDAPIVPVHDVNVASRRVQRRLIDRMVRRDPSLDPDRVVIADYNFRIRMRRAGLRLVQRAAKKHGSR